MRVLAVRLTIWSFCFVAIVLTTAPMHAQNADQQNQYSIVLPLELIAGQPATFAVLTADGHVSPGTKVMLSSGEVVTTDESGRAHFLVPSDAGVIVARIPGTDVGEAADVLPQDSSDDALQVTRIPKMVSVENHFSISGHGFQGDADRNRITMDGKAVLVLASSPVQLIVVPAANVPLGTASLALTEGVAETVTHVTLIGITSTSSSEAQVRRGKRAEIVLLARGTEEPLDLRIWNLNPQTVQLAKGSEAYVRTTGGPNNSAVLQLKGKNGGSFSFAISIAGSVVSANIPMARNFLLAAQKAAVPDIASRVEKILPKLDGKNVDVMKIRNDLQLLTEGGSGNFQTLIRASLRALNGE